MSNTSWRESVTGSDFQIDEAAGVIRNVKVIGNKSRNGRSYPQKTLQEAIPIYEGSRIYLDHVLTDGKAKPVSVRSIKDKWGVLKNLREAPEGGLRADIHYLKSHSHTPALIEAAQRFPETFGLSHDAAGDEVNAGGMREVTKIYKVNSVDVVNDPATNTGLFEGYVMKKTIKEIAANKAKFSKILEEMIAGDPMIGEAPVEASMDQMDDAGNPIESTPDEQVEHAFRAALIAVIDDPALDIPGKLAKLKVIMKASEQAMAAINGTSETPADTGSTPADKTTTESAKTEATNLQEQLNAALAEVESLKTASECRALLESANREVNPLRLKTLASIAKEDRAALVESWAPVRKATEKPAVSKSIITDELYTDAEYKPKSKKEFMESFR